MNPDLPCPHSQFDTNMKFIRVVDDQDEATLRGIIIELEVTCTDCGEKFRFNGVPVGFSGAEPTCNVSHTTINIPIRPASADPDFGMGLPGFSVQYRVEE